MGDSLRGLPVFFPFRYADDFVILVSGTREEAEHEKVELDNYLHQTTGQELSEEKTRISDLTEGFEFLGNGCATSGIRGSA
jgi:RNA-directed DNA polymerase